MEISVELGRRDRAADEIDIEKRTCRRLKYIEKSDIVVQDRPYTLESGQNRHRKRKSIGRIRVIFSIHWKLKRPRESRKCSFKQKMLQNVLF